MFCDEGKSLRRISPSNEERFVECIFNDTLHYLTVRRSELNRSIEFAWFEESPFLNNGVMYAVSQKGGRYEFL